MTCYVMLRCVMLCYAMLCYVMLSYVMLRCVMLCYVMLCYVMLRCVLLCYVMLRYTWDEVLIQLLKDSRIRCKFYSSKHKQFTATILFRNTNYLSFSLFFYFLLFPFHCLIYSLFSLFLYFFISFFTFSILPFSFFLSFVLPSRWQIQYKSLQAYFKQLSVRTYVRTVHTYFLTHSYIYEKVLF